MSLIKYRLKRDFSKTTEPTSKNFPKKSLQRFVIQEHYASRLHYDYRMEIEDEKTKKIVLKSWAVPKNIPISKGIRHLAIQTEDHPIEYIDFEGEIPKGNYGAGKVKIWDSVRWALMKGSLMENRISFNLLGKKIKGRYVMVKIKNSQLKNQNNWLIWRMEKLFLS